ncbi:hypothetical protein M3J09_001056 [Ascochyta lentis]
MEPRDDRLPFGWLHAPHKPVFYRTQPSASYCVQLGLFRVRAVRARFVSFSIVCKDTQTWMVSYHDLASLFFECYVVDIDACPKHRRCLSRHDLVRHQVRSLWSAVTTRMNSVVTIALTCAEGDSMWTNRRWCSLPSSACRGIPVRYHHGPGRSCKESRYTLDLQRVLCSLKCSVIYNQLNKRLDRCLSRIQAGHKHLRSLAGGEPGGQLFRNCRSSREWCAMRERCYARQCSPAF